MKLKVLAVAALVSLAGPSAWAAEGEALDLPFLGAPEDAAPPQPAPEQAPPATAAPSEPTVPASQLGGPKRAPAKPAADGSAKAKPAISRPMLPKVKGAGGRRDARIPPRLLAKKPAPHVNQLKLAEQQGFRKVSDLVAFPPFFPGLGIVTVKPDTLPVGPFRTFDRAGKLIATVYMLPLKDMDEHKKWDDVKGLPAPANHATFYYHPGHAGVEMPHYHLVIWHVSKKDEALVAQ